MKKLLTLLAFVLGYFLSHAQWDGTNPVFFNNGNVGIGTSTPSIWFGSKTLEFSDVRPVLKLNSTAPTSLGTIVFTNSAVNSSTHLGEFHLNYQFNQSNPDKSIIRWGGYPAGDVITLRADGNMAIEDNKLISLRGIVNEQTGVKFDFPTETVRISHTKDNYDRFISFGGYSSAIWNPQMTLNTKTGNVGIGTTEPDSKLTVKGDIHTREVRVDMAGSVAGDYVFEKDYNLLPLFELEAYINANKHLPEVPSAKRV